MRSIPTPASPSRSSLLPGRISRAPGGGRAGHLRGRRIDYFPYLLMAPGLLLVLFVTVYPLVFTVNYSLMRTQVFKQLAFVGLANYLRLFREPRFQMDLLNSLFFVLVGVALTWTLGLGLALFLQRQTWGNAVLKTIILIPWVTNQVVLALMWRWLLNGEFSPINYLLSLLHLPALDPLISTAQALPCCPQKSRHCAFCADKLPRLQEDSSELKLRPDRGGG